jgi:hypothetical protein
MLLFIVDHAIARSYVYCLNASQNTDFFGFISSFAYRLGPIFPLTDISLYFWIMWMVVEVYSTVPSYLVFPIWKRISKLQKILKKRHPDPLT